jgi:TPR repeat protein
MTNNTKNAVVSACLRILTLTLCSSLLLSCDAPKSVTPATFDHAADPLPFARPALKAQTILPNAPPLSEEAKKRLDLRRAFFAGDFAVLDPAVNQAHQRYVQGAVKKNESQSLFDSLEATQLAGIDICKDWIAAKPESYGAHLVCAAIWHNGAWVARSGEFSDKVTPVRFAMMRERLQRSDQLLHKAIGLSPKPVEALTLLAANRFLAGDKILFTESLDKAEQMMPGDLQVHETRMVYSLPEWGGSPAKILALMDRAKEKGVNEEDLLYLRDTYVARPHKSSTPGAERAYWEQAIAEKPTRARMHALSGYFERVQNWRDSVPATSRFIERFPDSAAAYQMRATANEKLGNIPAALSDYRTAAALGNNFATQSLIQAYVQGGMGLPAKNWTELEQVCRYGAALGSTAAANCMGSMFWEGGKIGPPFRTDIPQAFAWHLFAARSGYHNSQYDLGWLMLSGRAPGVTAEQAQTNGMFWLRRAAEQDHQYAKQKLREGGHPESEVVDEEAGGVLGRIKPILNAILRAIQ